MSKKRKKGPSLGLKREQDPAVLPLAERKKLIKAEAAKAKKAKAAKKPVKE